MSISYSNPSTRRRKRLAFGSSAALAIMAIPVVIGGQASAGAPPTQLAATVTIQTRDYDGGTSATITDCTLTGVDVGDDVTCITSSATAEFDSPNVNTGISVTVTGLLLDGANAAEYAIDPDLITASGDIESVTLTVIPDDLSAEYGDAEPTYTFVVNGFVNGEGPGSALNYVAPTCNSLYVQFDPVGSYPISCTGGSADNYTFNTTEVATLTVAEALLTVVPSDMTLNYGAPEPNFDFDVTGFVNSEDEVSAVGYSGPTCDSDYDAGDPVGEYTITCSGGSALDYTFNTATTATLTITPFVLNSEAVVYSGQTEAQTTSSSTTSARVTLSASITADFDSIDQENSCTEGGPSVSDATATFRDLVSQRVIATGVPIAEVGGNCEEGIATIFATLSTGQNGSNAYVIEVTIDGSFSGANDFQINNAVGTATVSVSVLDNWDAFNNSGELAYIPGSSYYSLGTEGSLTGGMDGEDAFTAFRFVPGTRKMAPKGQAVIVIPAANGGFYYIKSNSITSMKVGDAVTTVFTKASITLIGGDCETTCAIDGNVSLRLDITDGGSTIGYTVQSSKTSALYYSNDWYKDVRVWKTMPQTLS